jgi:hypothetical protein
MRARRGNCLVGITLAAALAGCSAAGPSSSASVPSQAAERTAGPTPKASASTTPTPSPTPSAGASSRIPGAVAVAGTHVVMPPPAGFVPAVAFPGFWHDASGSSVVVAEVPGPYSKLVAGLTDEGLAGKGIVVTNRTDVTIDGRPSLLLEGSQKAQDTIVGKVMLVTGTEDLTAIVTGNYPVDDAALGATIRESILATSFDPDRIVDQQASLRFTITPAPPLTFAGTAVNGAIYNTSGVLPSADRNEPSLIVVPSLGETDTSDLEALGRAQLLQVSSITDVVIENRADVTIAGLPGIELGGTARDTKAGADLFVYEVVLADGSAFVAMIGTCPIGRRAECLAAFQQTTRTYRPKD